MAVFHGLGDLCLNPGMISITKHIGKQIGAKAKCIESGAFVFSIFESFEYQAKKACNKILKDPDFQGEFSVFGLSQGGLIARYIAEKCPTKKPVRNLVTMGAPHTGVAAFPHCFHGIICAPINFVVKHLVYIGLVQDFVGPAGYFRDPAQEQTYIKHSIFLSGLNNEKTADANAVQRLSQINKAMLIQFEHDTMIYPKESAQFSELQKDGSITPFNQTAIYKEDHVGLKQPYLDGKIQFGNIVGDHLQFSYADLDEMAIPTLAA